MGAEKRGAWARARATGGAALAALALTAALGAGPAAAETKQEFEEAVVTSASGKEMVGGEVIVRFEAGASGTQRSASLDAVDSEGTDPVDGVPRATVVTLGEGVSIGEAIAELESRGSVAYAEPNYVYRPFKTPNDPLFDVLWGMDNFGQNTIYNPDDPPVYGTPGADIDAKRAWDLVTGTSDTRVAVVDTGVDAKPEYWHHNDDLVDVVNQEVSRNYYVPVTDPPGTPPYAPAWWDDVGHGTHVAGTIGAEGNNGIGVTGVNWDSDLIAIRVCGFVGGCTLEAISSGIAYAGEVGSRVANISLGGIPIGYTSSAAISAHPDTLYVIAAGNGEEYGDPDVGDNVDQDPIYPCVYSQVNILCVAATGPDDSLTPWSNYGATRVDLGAPGLRIVSTELSYLDDEDDYVSYSGTSMAAPHVAGAAALAFSARPEATALQVKRAIMDSVDPVPSLAGKTVTGGRLNARGALEEILNVSKCTMPNGTQYKTIWRPRPNNTVDVIELEKKGAGQSQFVPFDDFWGDVAKMEWWSPNTLSEAFTQAGQWGNPQATLVTNAWDYAHWYGAVDQREDVLATNPFNFVAPRVSFRTNGSGLVRDADVCNTFLNAWPQLQSLADKHTVITGDSMAVQMAKKLHNTTGWAARVEPQAKSSYATMRGEIRGLSAGFVGSQPGSNQYRADVIVMVLGTKDADAIAALPNATQRTAALNAFKANVDGALADTAINPCRIVVTTHETGWKPDGTYSAELKQARQDVNAKLRAVANASSSVDIVDWGQMSASHGAHTPVGTRWYEPTDRENPNAAGLTALSNAIIAKAQGSCS